MSIGVEFFIIILLVLANGILSLAEMAVVSARKARLQGLVKQGNTNAQTAIELVNSPSQFLSTVQIGITLVATLSAAIGGATIAHEFSDLVAVIPYLKPYSHAIGVGMVVMLITYLSLIIGELVPKRLALANPESIASIMAPAMQSLSAFAKPIVSFLSLSSDLVIKILPFKIAQEPAITEQEIEVMIDEGKEAGIFQTIEHRMLSGIFDLGEKRVSSVMTPLTKIVWINHDASDKEIVNVAVSHTFSRFPVGEESLDNILGFVNSRELLVAWLSDKTIDLKNLTKQALIIPSSKSVLDALKAFKKARVDAALVMDEYGALEGMVTITDIVRAIMGETPVGDEKPRWQIVARKDGSWLVDGLTPISEFTSFFHVSDQGPKAAFETVAGLIVDHLDHIPQVAEKLSWEGLSMEIIDMDGYRIDKVLVSNETK